MPAHVSSASSLKTCSEWSTKHILPGVFFQSPPTTSVWSGTIVTTARAVFSCGCVAVHQALFSICVRYWNLKPPEKFLFFQQFPPNVLFPSTYGFMMHIWNSLHCQNTSLKFLHFTTVTLPSPVPPANMSITWLQMLCQESICSDVTHYSCTSPRGKDRCCCLCLCRPRPDH